MNRMANPAVANPIGSSVPQLPLYLKETKYEFLRLLRARAFSLATIGFPVMFYLLFGIVVGDTKPGNAYQATYLLGTYCIFGLAGVCLFGISVTLANERALGWLEVKQASPMPAPAYLLSKLLAGACFALIIFGILSTLGTTMGHVSMSFAHWRHLALIVLGGVLPFAAMGLLLAMVVPPNAATGVVNLIYLPMSFLSGLWIPLSVLPKWIGRLAPVFPTWHLGQLALWSIGFGSKWQPWQHVLWLACFTLLALSAAVVLFQRNAAKA